MDKETLLKTQFFIDNEYLDKMLEIISHPDISGKTEKHHILPASVGGDNSESNLIEISVKQHFYVHYYLTLCSQGILKAKMTYAFKMMAFTRDQWKSINEEELDGIAEYYKRMVEEGCFKSNYERTDEIKKKISKTLKERAKQVKSCWVNNGDVEKYIPTEEAEMLIEEGWFKGRKKFSKEAVENIRQANLKIRAREREQDAEDGYISLKKLHGPRGSAHLTKADKMKAFYSNVEKAFKNHKCLVSEDGINFEMKTYYEIKMSNKKYFPKLYFTLKGN